MPFYLLYLKTDVAEYVVMGMHIILHSVVMWAAAKISYRYFKRRPEFAQLICFMLVANEKARQLNLKLFNDCILTVYVFLCMFFLSKGSPKTSTLFLTLGLSIKTGAILAVPGVLGWI